jgi:hypothetical protein
MKIKILLVGATAMVLAPALALAAPGGNGSTSPGSTNGVGYNHSHVTQTGQPGKTCLVHGPPPGNAADARGSAFNPNGIAGSVYAGQQPQNSRNTASVAQYDVACSNQVH